MTIITGTFSQPALPPVTSFAMAPTIANTETRIIETAQSVRPEASHQHFGVPSLGLQTTSDFLKEIVVRSRLEYIAAECLADDKPMKQDDLAQRFEVVLTCEVTDPPVGLADLLREARHRADSGSALAEHFLHEFDAACELHRVGETTIETIVHGLIVGHPELPRSDLIRRFLGKHIVPYRLTEI
jgi:hypothetical protein